MFAGISVLLAVPSAAVYGLVIALFAAGLKSDSSSGLAFFQGGLAVAVVIAAILGIAILPFTHSAVTYAAGESATGRTDSHEPAT